jgi:hypothetical protein
MTHSTGDQGQGVEPTPPLVPPIPPAAPIPPAPIPPAADYAAAPVPPAAAPATGGLGSGFGFDPQAVKDFDPKSVNVLDWALIGAGVLTFIFSLFHFYVVKVKGLGDLPGVGNAAENGWHGFFAVVAILLAIAASALLAGEVIAKLKVPFPVHLTVLAAYTVASLFLLIAFFVHPGSGQSYSGNGVSIKVGHGFGYWVTLIIALATTGIAYVRFTQLGGKLPIRR